MNIYALPTPKSSHYLNRYLKLISLARHQMVDVNYVEIHHILPESMGGLNVDSNLITLSARQHYLVHWMLWKAYKSKEMTAAFFSMSNQSNPHQCRERKITSRAYAKLRAEFSTHISKSTTELWMDPQYRQKHNTTNKTEKTKLLRSNKAKELWKDPVYVSKLLESRSRARLEGRVRTDHSKCSQSGDSNPMKRPEVRAKNTGDNHYSNREGYIKPVCPHCGVSSTPTNIKRWHGDNCKKKLIATCI